MHTTVTFGTFSTKRLQPLRKWLSCNLFGIWFVDYYGGWHVLFVLQRHALHSVSLCGIAHALSARALSARALSAHALSARALSAHARSAYAQSAHALALALAFSVAFSVAHGDRVTSAVAAPTVAPSRVVH